MKRQDSFNSIQGGFQKVEVGETECKTEPTGSGETEAEFGSKEKKAGAESVEILPIPFFLFFDVETNGNESFRPFLQTVTQVSWKATDRNNHVIESYIFL